MSHLEGWALIQAIEIAKAHAASGNIRPVEDVIKETCQTIKELDK